MTPDPWGERAEEQDKPPTKYSKALPRVFGDPLLQGIGTPDPRLADESTGHIAAYALGYIQELAARVFNYCDDANHTNETKRGACQLFLNVASDTAAIVHLLAQKFPAPIREIAETRANFPCLFPAHPDDRKTFEDSILIDLALGKLHPLRLRSPRKTFSKTTPINNLLLYYISKIRLLRSEMLRSRIADPFGIGSLAISEIERLCDEVPLTVKTAKRWLNVIWRLLLLDCPHPEKHNLLSALGQRPSRSERASFVKGKIRKTSSYVRGGIKDALGMYLVRMLRDQKQSESNK